MRYLETSVFVGKSCPSKKISSSSLDIGDMSSSSTMISLCSLDPEPDHIVLVIGIE